MLFASIKKSSKCYNGVKYLYYRINNCNMLRKLVLFSCIYNIYLGARVHERPQKNASDFKLL